MWHAGKAAVQSAAQSPEGKQQGSRWPWQQEDAANQVGVTVLLCSLHATGAVRCLFGDCNAEQVEAGGGTLQSLRQHAAQAVKVMQSRRGGGSVISALLDEAMLRRPWPYTACIVPESR